MPNHYNQLDARSKSYIYHLTAIDRDLRDLNDLSRRLIYWVKDIPRSEVILNKYSFHVKNSNPKDTVYVRQIKQNYQDLAKKNWEGVGIPQLLLNVVSLLEQHCNEYPHKVHALSALFLDITGSAIGTMLSKCHRAPSEHDFLIAYVPSFIAHYRQVRDTHQLASQLITV